VIDKSTITIFFYTLISAFSDKTAKYWAKMPKDGIQATTYVAKETLIKSTVRPEHVEGCF
jgi:hypothetical protein